MMQQVEELNYFLNCGYCKIPVKALSRDIRHLLSQFLKLNSIQIIDFKKVWIENSFSLIHYACTDVHFGRGPFMEGLYHQILHYLPLTNSINGKVAIIYFLYFLYTTQPSSPKRTPIPMDEMIWSKIKDIYQLLQEKNLVEPLYVLYKMLTQNYFNFCFIGSKSGSSLSSLGKHSLSSSTDDRSC